MPQNVVIVGAGGKMGARASKVLSGNAAWRVLLSENDAAKARALEENGLRVTPLDAALAEGDFVVLAVPDALIGRISRAVAPKMKPGAALVMLDAAAAYVGELPEAPGLTLMITHPCHPPFFTEQATPEARRDYFGGIAVQDILVSLIQGSEERFAEGVELCRTLFAPVNRAHRVTPEQFALLEPAMSELVAATAAKLMKDALELAVERGVPRAAAEAFMAGHAQIAMAIVFGAEPSPFSDAAKVAVKWGTDYFIRPEWKRMYDRDVLTQAIRDMIQPAG